MSKSTDIVKLAVAMVLTGEYEDTDAATLILMLREADNRYHNGTESFFSDSEYDAIKELAFNQLPNDPYFIGIGAEVRGGKVTLPFKMGSLTETKIGGETMDWVRKYKLENEQMVISAKLDGTSALIVYGNNGSLQTSFSRGNGVEGADTTRHLSKIASLPKKVSQPMVVRAEVIFPLPAWQNIKTKIKRSGGDYYKNPRNAVSGLMNASDGNQIAYDNLFVVGYEVIQPVGLNKREQLELLEEEGFTVPEYVMVHGYSLNDSYLTETLTDWRKITIYEYDGIVIDVNDAKVRQRISPSKDTLNPEWARKYKVADSSNFAETEVVKVEWNVSKNGYLKPRITVKPVDLLGVTVSHTTGYNAKYIIDNKINAGSRVVISRMGDVIPNIVKVLTQSTEPAIIPYLWKWSEKEVDAILVSPEENIEVAIQQTLDFFVSIDAPNLKEGTVREMFKTAHYRNAESAIVGMISATENDWAGVIGANGVKIYKGLVEKLNDIALYNLAGSTSFFGRGIGVRKLKALFTALDIVTEKDLVPLKLNNALDKIVAVEGFDEKTAMKIIRGVDDFLTFFEQIKHKVTLKVTFNVGSTDGAFAGKGVVFTGFRNKELEVQIEAQGGKMQSGVSKNTTYLVAADSSENSGKLKKARDLGVKVISQEQLIEMLGD